MTPDDARRALLAGLPVDWTEIDDTHVDDGDLDEADATIASLLGSPLPDGWQSGVMAALESGGEPIEVDDAALPAVDVQFRALVAQLADVEDAFHQTVSDHLGVAGLISRADVAEVPSLSVAKGSTTESEEVGVIVPEELERFLGGGVFLTVRRELDVCVVVIHVDVRQVPSMSVVVGLTSALSAQAVWAELDASSGQVVARVPWPHDEPPSAVHVALKRE